MHEDYQRLSNLPTICILIVRYPKTSNDLLIANLK